MPTLLLFNLDTKKRAAVQVIALRCGCRCVTVPTARYGATLAQLLSGGDAPEPPEQPFTEELLVMSGLEERRMDALLAALRQQRLPIALKAVVTPTNSGWTAQTLYAELCRERAAFASGAQAHE